VCLATSAASAQSTDQISGVIRDAGGAALAGVTVTVTCAAARVRGRTVTGVDGRYALTSLPVGRCSLEALQPGLDPFVRVIEVGATPQTVDVDLSVPALGERVTVTATRAGAEDVQAMPVAVTVVPAQTLAQARVESVEDLAGLVPTMTVSRSAGQGQVTIRGIGTNASATGADPSSTVHLDGVYLARPSMQLADLLDVERIEVLRGPQGTVYGRNSVGGTVHIMSRLPSNDVETRVRVAAGSYGMLRVEAALSGPIVKDRVMGSLAFLRGSRDGFVIDSGHPSGALGGQDAWAGRGQFRLILGRAAELRLSGDAARDDGIPLTYAQPLAAKPGFQIPPAPSLWQVRTDDPAAGHNTQAGGAATLVIHLGRTTTLTALTARRTADYRAVVDLDLIDRPLQVLDVSDVQHQFSQEVTVSGRTPRLTWVGGAFVLDEHIDGPVLITLHGPGLQRRPHALIDAQAWALFGDATYQLAPRISLTGGLRYSSESKSLSNTGGTYRLGTTQLADPASFYAFTDRATFDAWTPRLSLQVQASSDVFAYVSASRGFKSGGFNPSWPSPDHPYRPEFAWSYEGGLKSTVAGGRVQANVAAFHNDYRDLQVQSIIVAGLLDITNAASATVRGVEVEAKAAVWKRVHVAGQLAWLDARYDSYVARGEGGATRDAAGNRLANAPAWSGGTSVVAEFDVGSLAIASLRADVSWQSRVFFSPFNDRVETQEPYALAHLRAAWAPRHRTWELAVFARNLGNRGYVTGTFTAPVTAVGGRPGEPRQWGTEITLRR
jgi:iron complex outermembrane receptor protein